MTGGGDLDAIADEDDDIDPTDEDGDLEADDTDDGDDVAPPVAAPTLDLDLNDRIPSAGAADIGGRAGDAGDERSS